MLFERLRRVGAFAGLAAALAMAAPVGVASAAVPGQPTPLTITPEFAATIASGVQRDVALEEGVKVAQNGNRQIRRRSGGGQRSGGQRNVRRQVGGGGGSSRQRQVRRSNQRERTASRRDFQRERTASRRDFRRERTTSRRDYRRRAYNTVRRDVRRGRYYNGFRHYHRGRWYTYRDDRWYDNGGAIVAAGLIGLTAGALIGSANSGVDTVVVVDDRFPAPFSAEWYRQCDRKYNSFRASDGTFLGFDGVRRTCRLP